MNISQKWLETHKDMNVSEAISALRVEQELERSPLRKASFLSVRLLPREKEDLIERAESCGKILSEYVRALLGVESEV